MNEEKVIEQIRKDLRRGWLHWLGVGLSVAMFATLLVVYLTVEQDLVARIMTPDVPKNLNAAVFDGFMRDIDVMLFARIHAALLVFSGMSGLFIGMAIVNFYLRRKDRLLVSMWDRLKALESKSVSEPRPPTG